MASPFSASVAGERRAPRPRAARPGPALVVLAIVAVVFLGGVALALTSSTPRSSVRVPPGQSSLPGLPLAALPAGPVVARIASAGQPPADVVDALVVPVGARVTGTRDEDAGVSQYDRSVELSVPAAPSELRAFYRAELAHLHWTFLGEVPLDGGQGTEILAKRASVDGYYWEVGVLIAPAEPAISPALAGGSSGPTSSTLELRILEMSTPA